MKKDKCLNSFIEGVEMTVLPQEDQVLLETGALKIFGVYINFIVCNTTNDCNGGNCISGCGA